MKSVKLQEIIDDIKNRFMIVSKVVGSDNKVSETTEETYQKVMAIVQTSGRILPDPNVYLSEMDFISGMEPPQISKDFPLFVLSAVSSNKGGGYTLQSTEPELTDSMRGRVVFMSNSMLIISENSIHLIRSKIYPSNIRVEI